MRSLLILFLALSYFSRTSLAQENIKSIEDKIFNGKLIEATRLIEQGLKSSSSNKAMLYKLKGDISKVQGDIDQAFVFWKKSNEYRTKTYPKGDYRLVWNYALLSNYHYEKINTELAVRYADSCLGIVSGLTFAQQKELEVFKIWNILGQSYKQSTTNLSFEQNQTVYQKAQGYYLKSIDFIKSNNIDEHYLAETYRLLGNSYLDLTHSALLNKHSDAKFYFQNSTEYYSKSLYIWKNLYGTKHYELARTYFVQGLLNYYVNDRLGLNSYENSISCIRKSINAYGVDVNSVSEVDLEKIPNKEDFLMTCKYLTLAYFKEFQKDSEFSWLGKAERINQIAIRTWESIHLHFDGSNTNQNLAIYNLVPFSESITIELFKKQSGFDYSLNTIFKANQKLKYYDLLKYGGIGKTISAEINIRDLQKRLKSGEVFLDFHISLNTKSFVVLRITNQSHELIELPYLKNGLLEQYLKSIESFDFDSYTKSAYEIHQAILKPCKVDNNNLILCLDGWLNTIPFEALLTSKNNWNKKDYRQLDYMLIQNRFQYVLNPQLFRRKQPAKFEFKIEAFIPNNTAYSSLPFSGRLGEKLHSEFSAQVHSLTDATKLNFLNLNRPIVHLSGHGVISSDDMMNSYLVFSDSMLYLDDLANLRNVPALMVLNTCNSANGKMYYGEGVNGFVRTLNMLGIRSTLSNLWEVDDMASNKLMVQLYSLLREGKSTTEALYLAQMDMINRSQSSNMAAPYYWAGHRLTGEEILFEKEKSDDRGWLSLYWLLLLLFLITGVFWRRKIKKKYS